MLRALGSASCDITHKTGGTICYVHWVLRLVILYTRQEVRFVTGHTRDRGHDLLRAFGSASCDITQETGSAICDGQLVLCLVISHTRQEVRFVTSIAFCVL